MKVEPIAIHIKFSGGEISGSIVKINPTGVLVELDRVPYQIGNNVTIKFTLAGVGELEVEARPIKTYDQFKKKIRKDTEGGSVVEELIFKISELHYVDPPDSLKSGIMNFLTTLRANLIKKSE